MADIPFFSAIQSGGGGGSGGVTCYDALTNKPITNLTGAPVIISKLSSGIYNIDGTWAITPDDSPRQTSKDDLFCVLNDNSECKLTWIRAGEIKVFNVPQGGSSSDIYSDGIAVISNVVEELVGTF